MAEEISIPVPLNEPMGLIFIGEESGISPDLDGTRGGTSGDHGAVIPQAERIHGRNMRSRRAILLLAMSTESALKRS